MIKGDRGETLITTKDLREKFELCDEQVLSIERTIRQQLSKNDVQIIWARVWENKKHFLEGGGDDF